MLKFLPTILIFFSWLSYAATEEKDWTVYIHMNGDNNLCTYTNLNLNQLMSGDVSTNANIIVAFDCEQYGDSRLFKIEGTKKIDLVPTGQEFDMGDSKFLTQTALKVFQDFPSKKRMVVIWNHGSGWSFTIQALTTKGISYDDQSGNHITTTQLGETFREISTLYPISIVGFDACLMQMAEVAYEFSEYAEYTLGSEDLEPGEGWDYKGMVKALSKEETSPEELGTAIVDAYYNAYNNDFKESVTLSLIDNKKLIDFTQELGKLVPFFTNKLGMKKIVNSLPGWTGSSKDIGLFFNKLQDQEVVKAKRLYKEVVVYSKATEPATGLAIYMSTYPNEDYLGLKFAQDTNWFSFLKNMK